MLAAIDLLVNNAGLALGLEPAQRASLDDWERMVDTNIKGLMTMTRAVLPGMVARDRRARDQHRVDRRRTGPTPARTSTARPRRSSTSSRSTCAPIWLGTRVRVTVVDPGMVGGTEFSSVRFHGDEARAAQVYEGADPLTPEDVAETVFMGGDAAGAGQRQLDRADAGEPVIRGAGGRAPVTVGTIAN